MESLAAGFRHPLSLQQIRESVDRCRMCNLISRSIFIGRGVQDCRDVHLDCDGFVGNGGPPPLDSIFSDDKYMGHFRVRVERGKSTLITYAYNMGC